MRFDPQRHFLIVTKAAHGQVDALIPSLAGRPVQDIVRVLVKVLNQDAGDPVGAAHGPRGPTCTFRATLAHTWTNIEVFFPHDELGPDRRKKIAYLKGVYAADD